MRRKIVITLLLATICTALPACAGGMGGVSGPPSAGSQQKQALVRQALDRLVAAYESKNSRLFSEGVSDAYVGEKTLLDTAVRRDFSSYHNLALRYTINNITMDDTGGRAAIAITFTREWTEIKTAKTRNDTQETVLVFIREDGNYKLYSQKLPVLFGLN